MNERRVLVTDGASKHTLAAVRSLGTKDIKVTVIDRSPLAQAFYSKYCKRKYLVRFSPDRPDRFIRELKRILRAEQHEVLLPISWYANYHISRFREELEPYIAIPVASHASMEIAANKDKTMKFAADIGVDIPRTFAPSTEYELQEVVNSIEFPLVIKGSTGAGHVYYPRNEEELVHYYSKIKALRPIVQEYVKGIGHGFFALYNRGKCVAFFMHKRLREFPTTGGPSTAAISYFSKSLMKQGMRILDRLSWHGVAMVEFKRSDVDGKYYLMEINPKFWGSLELAIKAGVDFPYLAYEMARNEDFEPVFGYRKNVIFRWPFPADFLNSLSTRSIGRFLSDFTKKRYHHDLRISDPLPTVLQLVTTYRNLRIFRTGGK